MGRFRILGAHAFIRNLEGFGGKAVKAKAMREAAEILRDEAFRLAPRKSGLMESEIEIRKSRSGGMGVGVYADSPAYIRAVSTEYGTENIVVGTPQNPRRSWPTKSKSTASMPWLRTALVRKRKAMLAAMRRSIWKR